MRQVISEYCSFPYQLSFHQLFKARLQCWDGTKGVGVADEASELSLTPRHKLPYRSVLKAESSAFLKGDEAVINCA